MSVPPETLPAEQVRTPRKKWPLIAAGAGAAIVVALVLFFALRGGGGGVNPSSGTPAFSFKLIGTKGVPGVSHADRGAIGAVADNAAKDIHDVLDRMYKLAFLDPSNWKAGKYDNVFGFFDLGASASRAKADVDTLTLGPDAGSTFSDVQPSSGTLSVEVLVDKGGQPVSATASVVFKAKATGNGGAGEIVVSKGQYFMHILEGGWSIFGYSVARDDRPLKATSTPSGASS